MAIRHSITLSTSEPNNEVGNLKIRQGDEQTQTLVANITENGVPKPFVGLQPFFCAKLGQTAGLGIIEQKVTGTMNPANGTLEYVMQPEDWQQLGRQTAYFSFRKMVNDHEWTEQFSTRDFNYNVIKSAFSEGLREVKKDGSTYVWTIEDMLRLFDEYIASGKTDWEEFVEQNREVLESVDPGGKILGEIILARGGATTLGERLDSEKAEVSAQLQQKLPEILVTEFGATPNANVDQTPFIEDAISYLKMVGGGTLLFPDGVFKIIADDNTKTDPYNPKRVEIRGYITGEETPSGDTRVVNFVENIHIKGNKNTVIYMTGMTEDYLYNHDDIQMSNVDIFTAFSFAYAKNCSVSNIKFKGDYLVEGRAFRYTTGVSQARAKAVAFFGSHDCEVYDCEFDGILGNFVHVNTASRLLDDYWMPSSNINIFNNKGNLCLEIGINLTTLTDGCKIYNNTISHANGAAIEGPGTITNNTIYNCKGGGISPSYDAVVTENTIENVRDAFVLAVTSDKTNQQRLSSFISGNIIKNIRRHVLNVYPGSGNTNFVNNQISNPNLENTENQSIIPMIFLNGSSAKKIKNMVISGNKIEVTNPSVKSNYGVFAQFVEDSQIENNIFDVISELVLLADIYRTDTRNVGISKNTLSKGLGQGVNNKDRNVVSENVFLNNKMPITSDWYSLTPPNEGEWQIGDFLKKTPTVTPNLDGSYTLNLGWRCVSINPLTWQEEKIKTTGDKQARGNATISTGLTSVTISHGLNGVPTHINVTPRGRVGFFWITDVTATTFKLNCSETSSFDQLVWWSVNI